MKIAIIDYESGNLKSASKAVELASNNILNKSDVKIINSANELKNFDNLPAGYEEIVKLKNINIIDEEQNILSKIDLIRDVIFDNQHYKDLIESNNYLN